VATEPEQEWPTNPNYFPKWKRRSEMPTISFSTKTVLRAGSLVAGLGSVIWGLYAVLAFQVVVTTTKFSESRQSLFKLHICHIRNVRSRDNRTVRLGPRTSQPLARSRIIVVSQSVR